MKTTTNTVAETKTNVKKANFKLPEEMVGVPATWAVTSSDDIVQMMNRILANEYALFTKTLNFHWNLTGPRFHSLHKFLDDQYHTLLEVIDDVAERVREIGGHPRGTMREFVDLASISEKPNTYPDTNEMLSTLVADHRTLDMQIKAVIGEVEKFGDDPATVDFLTALLAKHEQMGWMLKSHLG